MSTHEYNDLFLKCQNTGKYHVFTFDVKNSKNIGSKDREILQHKLIELILTMYKILKYREQKENRQILVFDEDFIYLEDNKSTNGFGLKIEPFILGDVIGLTTYRNSIKTEEILELFNELKKNLSIDYEFHINDGYYETNDWTEAHNKYFRGHCIDLLSNMHKKENKKIKLKKLSLK